MPLFGKNKVTFGEWFDRSNEYAQEVSMAWGKKRLPPEPRPDKGFDKQFSDSLERAKKKRERGEFPYDNPIDKVAKPKKKDRRKGK